MKQVVILGSTGSIGTLALDVISRHRDEFDVVGLVARRNIDLLEKQVRIFDPDVVGVFDEDAARELKKRLGSHPEVYRGEEGIASIAAAAHADFVLSALVGFSGLIPTMHAVRAGKTIGLANKESLVVAGMSFMEESRKHGAQILPVDSEHSAVFQCVDGHGDRSLRRIILTASGGPFRGMTMEQLHAITPEDALRHPNWSMGRKVTIDSATLMNKGLEVIEASHLFGLPAEKIDVLVHPQSIIHSMTEFHDGSVLAQLSIPDMRGPIAYALSYPRRLENIMPPLNLESIGRLTFHKPDTVNFPCLQLAYAAMKEGGTMPAVLNAVNEVAVHAFLEGRITFLAIPVIIEKTLHAHEKSTDGSLDAVIEADRWARIQAEDFIGSLTR